MEITRENIKLIGFKENSYYMKQSNKYCYSLSESYEIRVEFNKDSFIIYLFSGDEFNKNNRLNLKIKNIEELKNLINILE